VKGSLLLGLLAALAFAAFLGNTGPSEAASADPVLVGAGDIAHCAERGDERTARLLGNIPGTVFTTGDNAYDSGTAGQFRNCYDPTWGRYKARTRPVPGNHDYETRGAAPYFRYFGAKAGPAGRGYYSYDLGAWHVVTLNSERGFGPGSAQQEWLGADLAANSGGACTLAYWHHPVFSSGEHGSDPRMAATWKKLDEAGVDVVLTGHEHSYERFAPQTHEGVADPNGIRQFVVGTGGRDLRPFRAIVANSEARNSRSHGVLKLTLHAASYEWEFVPVGNSTFRDSGSEACTG
jgi:acid phosphatase type 7